MIKDGFTTYNSVMLDLTRCNGCINCMKRCPTEAIRVRNGKAKIDKEACVGCGECIRICKSKAKIPVYDSLSVLEACKFKYKIAIPEPSLYAQFDNLADINLVLNGLKEIGFDGVYENALGCEVATRAAVSLFGNAGIPKPVISSACPAILKLILFRYESLAEHISPVFAPEEISAELAREEAIAETGYRSDEIGIFFISPCSSNVCSLKTGAAKRHIDFVLSQNEVYFKLLSVLPKISEPRKISKAGRLGLSWAVIGGEAKSLRREKFLAADGIENAISILDALDRGSLSGLDFVELSACPGGCVGGVLNVENPFVARSKIKTLKNAMQGRLRNTIYYDLDLNRFIHNEPYEPFNLHKLSDDRLEAMRKLMELNSIHNSLPGLDCGACGAPSCRAFAEDVVRGIADAKQCRRRVKINNAAEGQR